MKKRIGIFSSPLLVLILLLIVEFIIFVPHVGKGFVSDDFTWLENVVPDGKVDYLKPFTKTTGFFRPLVGLSFGLQFQMHGMDPRPYGFFNLFLHMLNIILVFLLLTYWEKTRPYAIWATVLFALNARGVNMAVGWISGRTTLLFSFFILLTLYLYLRLSKKNPLRFLLTALFFFAALLSKETAAAAPIFIFFFSFFGFNKGSKSASLKQRLKSGLGSIVVFVFPLIVYFLLRFSSDAMSPHNALGSYSYSLSPLLILKNLSEYIIRAGLLDIYIIIILLLIMLISKISTKEKGKQVESLNLPVISQGLLWFLVFLLPLLPIPTRSDLYVYFSQVGLHIAGLTIIFLLWRRLYIKKSLTRYASRLLICLLSIIWIGYLFFKAVSIGERGEASARFTGQVVFAAFEIPARSRILIIDNHYGEKHSPSRVVSYGFNSLLNLYYPEKSLNGEIISSGRAAPRKDKQDTYSFIWKDGSLKKISK